MKAFPHIFFGLGFGFGLVSTLMLRSVAAWLVTMGIVAAWMFYAWRSENVD